MTKIVRNVSDFNKELELVKEYNVTEVVERRKTKRLIIDDAIAEFIDLGFNDTAVEVRHGIPKDSLKHPSIYVKVNNVQADNILGRQMYHTLRKDNRLEIRYEQDDKTGFDNKIYTDIHTRDAPVSNIGYIANGSCTIACYSDNFRGSVYMAEHVFSLIEHNLDHYLRNISDFNEDYDEEHDPKILRMGFTGFNTDYTKVSNEAKYVWATTVGYRVSYIIKVPKYYTYITEIEGTQYTYHPGQTEPVRIDTNIVTTDD